MQTNGSKTTQYITTEEVADKLQVHWQTVLDLIRSGLLTATKVGKQYRINPADLDAFIGSHTNTGLFQAKERFDERAKSIITGSAFSDTRVLIIGCSFPQPANIPDLFAGSNSPAGQVLSTSTDRLRSMGWHLDPVSNQTPKPSTGGESLEISDKLRIIRAYKDGAVIGVGQLDGYLSHVGQLYQAEEEKFINALAVCEFIANFFIKVSKLTKIIEPHPQKALVSMLLFNPKANKLTLRYSMNSLFGPEQIGDSFQLKEQRSSFEADIKSQDDIAHASGTLWKEFGHIFGLLDDQLPLLDTIGHIDTEAIKKKV